MKKFDLVAMTTAVVSSLVAAKKREERKEEKPETKPKGFEYTSTLYLPAFTKVYETRIRL